MATHVRVTWHIMGEVLAAALEADESLTGSRIFARSVNEGVVRLAAGLAARSVIGLESVHDDSPPVPSISEFARCSRAVPCAMREAPGR
jgi:hypothetical protein